MTQHALDMSQTLSLATEAEPATGPSETKARGAARIDAPHVVDGASTEAASARNAGARDEAPDVLPPEDEAALARELRVQAAQLAEYLRTRQSHLDRREAQLNGREAQLDNETRAARLWVEEAQAELRMKAAELTERQQEMQRCLARLADVEKTRQRREEEYAAREAASAERERAVDDARRLAAAGQHAREEASNGHTPIAKCDSGAETVGEESAPVDRGERAEAERLRWEELQHQAEQLYQALQKDRRDFDERRRRHEEQSAARTRHEREDIDRKRRELARRGEEVDRSRAALVQLRDEVEQIHRETLSLRLAAEEVWARLSGAAPPAALVHSLGEIRRQLAESYRGAGAAVAEQKQQLVALGIELRRQHERLTNDRKRLEQWLASQEREIQERAARLVARERQLDAQESRLRDEAAEWQIDRLACHREIERLRRES